MPVAKFNLAHLDGKHVYIDQSHTDDLDQHPSPRPREDCVLMILVPSRCILMILLPSPS